MLVIGVFSSYRNVSFLPKIKLQLSIHIFVVCKSFEFGQVKYFVVWLRVKDVSVVCTIPFNLNNEQSTFSLTDKAKKNIPNPSLTCNVNTVNILGFKKKVCTLFSAVFHCPLSLMSTYLVKKSRSEHVQCNRDFKF